MTINKHGRRSFLVLCSMTVVATDGVAANGNKEEPALEEIVVTAQLREQSLQDVPISIQVLGAGEIADMRIDDISDIGYEVPGLSIYSFLPGQVNPSIRGAMTFNDAPGVEQSVAMFMDGVYIGQTGFFSFDLFRSVLERSGLPPGEVTFWVGMTSLLQNAGAFFGIYAFTHLTQRVGRRPAFAIAFVAALLSTAFTFWNLNDFTDIFWMIPLMGFCQLSLFGGYAIYLPELFPTRLRSTGTSFCYNVGRFVAAVGPLALGLLTSRVFAGYPEPMRYAGVTMCLVFVIGLATVPFAPETKGRPLPE